jgi:hypothetical protein
MLVLNTVTALLLLLLSIYGPRYLGQSRFARWWVLIRILAVINVGMNLIAIVLYAIRK